MDKRNSKYDENVSETFDQFWQKENGSLERSRVVADVDLEPKKEWTVLSWATLKGLLLFVPGTIMLSFVGIIFTIIITDIFIIKRPYADLPENAVAQIVVLALIGMIAGLMTWFGIGDLKDRRHIALPLTVLSSGVAIGVVGLILEYLLAEKGDFIEFLSDTGLVILMLRLLLMLPVFVRQWLGPADVDRRV